MEPQCIQQDTEHAPIQKETDGKVQVSAHEQQLKEIQLKFNISAEI